MKQEILQEIVNSFMYYKENLIQLNELTRRVENAISKCSISQRLELNIEKLIQNALFN